MKNIIFWKNREFSCQKKPNRENWTKEIRCRMWEIHKGKNRKKCEWNQRLWSLIMAFKVLLSCCSSLLFRRDGWGVGGFLILLFESSSSCCCSFSSNFFSLSSSYSTKSSNSDGLKREIKKIRWDSNKEKKNSRLVGQYLRGLCVWGDAMEIYLEHLKVSSRRQIARRAFQWKLNLFQKFYLLWF